MSASRALLSCLLFLFFCHTAFGQKDCHLIFKETIGTNKVALRNHFQSELKGNAEEGKSRDSLSGIEQITAMEITEAVDSGLSDKNSYSLYEISREGSFVINRELNKPTGSTIVKKVDLLTCDLTVVDSFTFRKIDSVRITFHSIKDLSDVKYIISKSPEQKVIKGYDCEKISITETSGHDHETETRYFEIWATRQIKPAIPVYGVLQLSQRLLADYTPLAFKEYGHTSMPIFSESIVTEIHCPHLE